MKRLFLASVFSFISSIALAQSCNTPVPWYTNYGTMVLGNTPQLGPACNQLQDSGININTLSNSFTALQNSVTALQAQVNSITAPVLLATLVANNSATLQDTTHITSAFSEYEIVLEQLDPTVSNVELFLQVHENGTFPSTSYISGAFAFSGIASGNVTSTTAIPLSNGAIVQSGDGISGLIRLSNPNTTNQHKFIYGQTQSHDGSGDQGLVTGGFWNGGFNAVDGFQVFFSSNTIAFGTLKLYGLP